MAAVFLRVRVVLVVTIFLTFALVANGYYISAVRTSILQRCSDRSSFLPRSSGASIRAMTSGRQPAARTVPTMRWQEVSSSLEVPASAEAAFSLYKDLNRHPEWSPWLREVDYEPASGHSKWVLSTRGVTVEWYARNTKLEEEEEEEEKEEGEAKSRRIAWETMEGDARTLLPNKGDVKFTDTGPNRSEVRLAISFDAPGFVTVLVSNVGVLKAFIERTLNADLKRFRQVLVCELEQQARLSAVPTILSPVDEDNDAGGVDLLGAL